MTLKINDSGTWKEPTKVSVKDGGAWKEVLTASVKDGGSWKPFYQRKFTYTVSSNVNNVQFVHGSGGVIFDSTYKFYKIFLTNLITNTGNAQMRMRFGAGDLGLHFSILLSGWSHRRAPSGESLGKRDYPTPCNYTIYTMTIKYVR